MLSARNSSQHQKNRTVGLVSPALTLWYVPMQLPSAVNFFTNQVFKNVLWSYQEMSFTNFSYAVQNSSHLPKKYRFSSFIVASKNFKPFSWFRVQNISSIFLTLGHLDKRPRSFSTFFFLDKSKPYMQMTSKSDFTKVSLLAFSKSLLMSFVGSKSKCLISNLQMWLICRSFL